MSAPKPPEGLKPAGRALWSKLTKRYEFTEGELPVLELACRQLDDLRALEAAVAKHGVMTTGSKGQPRLSQAVVEVRQARLAIGRLLGQLALPVEDAEDAQPMTEAQRRSGRAAETRWAQVEQRRARRTG